MLNLFKYEVEFCGKIIVMIRLFKLFLIILYSIFSLGVIPCKATCAIKSDALVLKNPISRDTVVFDYIINNDTAFVASNNNISEIATLKSELESDFGVYYGSAPENFHNKNFTKNYYINISFLKSHSISTTIKNEINIRAP